MPENQLKHEYDEACLMFEEQTHLYDLACKNYPELYDNVQNAEIDVSCADIALEYATMNNVDTTEAENKLNYAKCQHQDLLFQMNSLVPQAYENKVYAELRYVTARRAYYRSL
jgi:hypothetical protein